MPIQAGLLQCINQAKLDSAFLSSDFEELPNRGCAMTDDIDQVLITALMEDSRRSLKALAQISGLSSPSVAERLRRLEERGVLKGYTVEIDPKCFGYQLQAIVRIRPLPGSCRKWNGRSRPSRIHRMRQGDRRRLLHRAPACTFDGTAGHPARPAQYPRRNQYGHRQENPGQTPVAADGLVACGQSQARKSMVTPIFAILING
jgi:hypothetical protein